MRDINWLVSILIYKKNRFQYNVTAPIKHTIYFILIIDYIYLY